MYETKPAASQMKSFLETRFSTTKHSRQEFIQDKIDSGMAESSDATIRRVLSLYDLGKKLRQLRMRKKISLTNLGTHTGLSPSMLSQLENGKLIPTLPTLARIAMFSMLAWSTFLGTRSAGDCS